MEQLDMPCGILIYETQLPAGAAGELRIREPHDLAQVFVDSTRVGSVDRRWRRNTVSIPPRSKPVQLDIMVEAFGRVNFGGDLHDRKGITDRIDWTVDGKTTHLSDWTHFKLSLVDGWSRGLKFMNPGPGNVDPCVYDGSFELKAVGDTFLDMREWKRGMVWVNGHNLGRYWNIGPQQTMYCPGCWLKLGRNEILILDSVGGLLRPSVRGLNAPILNEVREDPDAPTPLRRAGHTLALDNVKPVGQASLEAGPSWQSVSFEPVKGRFICVEALDSQSNDAFTTCAEFRVLDRAGMELPNAKLRAIYADSEELSGDEGAAVNVLDGANDTFWHTQWQSGSPKHPHQLVIDLGQEESVTGVRILPRQDSPNGRMKSIRVYVSADKFEGL